MVPGLNESNMDFQVVHMSRVQIALTKERESRWDLPALTYHYNQNATSDDIKGVITIACPKGHVATLPHQIMEDGTVEPSIVCPYSECDWHVWAKLLDWTWGHRPDTKQD